MSSPRPVIMRSKRRAHSQLVSRLACRPFLLVAMSCLHVSCESTSAPAPELTFPCVSWCNTVAPWPHDGNPFEGQNFTVYSDGASLKARSDLAAIAEGVLADLTTRFAIPSNDLFIFPPNQTKIHLYAFKNRNPTQWGGQGFWGGFIIYSLDHPQRSAAGLTEIGPYTRLVTHELTHVLQSLLVGSTHSYSTHTWFEEGLGEFISALNPQRSIMTLTDLNDLVDEYGELNPIAIHNDVYPAIQNIGVNYYYPMFELTMRYLLDERGMDCSLLDVKQVFLEMRDGMNFATAFQRNFGLSVSELQTEFFDRIRAFLN